MQKSRRRRASRRILRELIFFTLVLGPLAAADYYSSPYNHFGSFYGGGRSSSEPTYSLSFDPKENLDNAFRIAARENDVPDLEKYLKQGAAIDSTSDHGMTALMYGARNCSPAVVRYLLQQHAALNLRDDRGETALILAAKDSCLPVTELLTHVPGVDVSARDRSGMSALDYAGLEFQLREAIEQALHRKPAGAARTRHTADRRS